MSFIKNFSIWLAIVAMSIVSFVGTVKAEPSNDEFPPKFEICLLATQYAIDGYKMKEAKKKIKYAKVDDIFVALLMKQAIEIGYYKATSIESAAVESFAACADHKIWN